MPLSRRQLIEQHARRIGVLEEETRRAEEGLQSAADMDTIAGLRGDLARYAQETQDCKHAIGVLERQIEEAEREKAARDVEVWESTERPQIEQELDGLIEVCFRRLQGFGTAYENLTAAEQRGIARWNERGGPGKRPFMPRAQQDVYAFLSVEKRGRRSALRPAQARAHEILGFTAQEKAIRRLSRSGDG